MNQRSEDARNVTAKAVRGRVALCIGIGVVMGVVFGAHLGRLVALADAATDSQIETRLAKVEAELAIIRLFADYGYFLDDRNLRAYAELFADDGEWIGGVGRAKGREEIFRMMSEADLSPNHSESGHLSVHVVTNPRINIEGDRAAAWSKFTVFEKAENGTPRVRRVGHYRDQLVREGDAWKFLQRIVYGDIPENDPLR